MGNAEVLRDLVELEPLALEEESWVVVGYPTVPGDCDASQATKNGFCERHSYRLRVGEVLRGFGPARMIMPLDSRAQGVSR